MQFFRIVAFIGSFSVNADLIGWNRLSGSVTRASKGISTIIIGGNGRSSSLLDQYIEHFGIDESAEARRKIIRNHMKIKYAFMITMK